MAMSSLELGAFVLVAAAAASWLNAVSPKQPIAVALLILGMVAALGLRAAGAFWPGLIPPGSIAGFIDQIDYPELVLNFLLAYLLFAGAMNVNVGALMQRGAVVLILATVGVAISALIIGAGFWWITSLVGHPVPFLWSVVFGLIVSPTDPVAVLATVKRTTMEPLLRAQIEGEALFNDGIAVVFFRAALALALAQGAGSLDPIELAGHVAWEALGGAALGLAAGGLTVLVMRAIDDWAAETLITLAVATAVYAACLRLGLSGPIGVVMCGLVIGSAWGQKTMSDHSQRYLQPFWHLIDENLNGILFLLMGLSLFGLEFEPYHLLIALAVIPLGLAARWLSIALPAAPMLALRRKVDPGLITLLTWAGVRGGLSAAMALSLPESPFKSVIVAATFAIAVFSIVVQSTTAEWLVVRTGYGTRTDAAPGPS